MWRLEFKVFLNLHYVRIFYTSIFYDVLREIDQIYIRIIIRVAKNPVFLNCPAHPGFIARMNLLPPPRKKLGLSEFYFLM